MIAKSHKKRLVSSLKGQVRAFDVTARALMREFGKMKEVEDSVALINRLAELVTRQHKAALEIIEKASALAEADGNRSPALFAGEGGQGTYEFLTAQRKMVEHIGEIDEWNKALRAIADVMDAVDKNDKAAYEAACIMSWRLSSFQYQIHALARQAQAITMSQEAVFRALGLKFWQGHKRYLRWEGDGRTS